MYLLLKKHKTHILISKIYIRKKEKKNNGQQKIYVFYVPGNLQKFYFAGE
jgi:hypothetical protein